jgi:signal transduction histidine kinase
MPSWRRVAVPAAVLIAGTGFALVAEAQQLGHADRPLAWLVGDFVGGWTFVLVGAILLARHPANRIGPLMVAVGLTWFVGTFNRADADWAVHLARTFQGWYEPLLGVLVLAFPSGIVRGRLERLVAVGWLVEQGAWTLAQLVLARPLSWYGCATCPGTIDEFIVNQERLELIAPISLALATGFAIAAIVLAVRRLARSGPAGRRRLLPVALTSVALLLGVVAPGGYRLLVDESLFANPLVTALYYVALMLAAVAVLGGLLQERLARTAVAELVVDLPRVAGDVEPDPRRLRDALARALGDPTLELFVREAQGDRFLDVTGAVTDVPMSTERRAVTRIGRGDDVIAVIAHDPSLLDDPGLVSAVTTAVRLEADNRQLTAEVDRQLDELRESRARIVTATDAERRRVERDLHDGAQQRLVALSMELGRLRRTAAATADPTMLASLAALSSELEAAIEELRELARGILPPILTDAGLGAAVESLALRAPLPVDADVTLGRRLPAAVESTLYFVIAEGLANVARHAEASHASVRVSLVDSRVRAEVSDDGVGGAEAGRGSGLQGLVDRVGALGGTLVVRSRPGGGTQVTAEIPVPA